MTVSQTILVVDDEMDVLTLLDLELSREGYTVIKASSGKEAVNKAGVFVPDLIILDILMPDMNGGQVVTELKLNIKTRNIPIIFLTAVLSKEEQKNRHLGVSIDQHLYPAIAKPFEVRDFLQEVNKQLPRSVR